jgi:hypothetical protein
LQANLLNGVTNFDVTSNIVLNYGQNISAVSGKFIHIVNEGGAGFHGESAINTLDISVTDTTQVTIVNGKVVINPLLDLDLANNYHISVDAGAFTSTVSGVATPAFDGTTALKFSTVTPGTSSSGDMAQAALSQAMDASGNLVNSYKWFDVEKLGTPTSSLSLTMNTGKYALVAKDYSANGAAYMADPSNGNQLVAVDDGIQVADFNVASLGFGADDLVYIDNQTNTAANDLSATTIVFSKPPTVIQFTGYANDAIGSTGFGGFLKFTFTDANANAGFTDLAGLRDLIQANSIPVISV